MTEKELKLQMIDNTVNMHDEWLDELDKKVKKLQKTVKKLQEQIDWCMKNRKGGETR